MASLTGRVVTITGAASGMGKAFARLAASRGAKLALADVQQEKLEELAAELRSTGAEATSTTVDISSQTQVDDWINDTVKHYGKLDGSANMAGVLGRLAPIKDTTNQEFDHILGVNLYGTINCVRAQVKVMEKGASIVNIASIAGTSGLAGRSAYCVSKHGVIGLTKSVAREIAADGIRINAIAPGAIDTPMSRAAGASPDALDKVAPEQIANYISPMMRFGQADEVANVVAFLLSDESSFMHGSVCAVDGALGS